MTHIFKNLLMLYFQVKVEQLKYMISHILFKPKDRRQKIVTNTLVSIYPL